MIDSTTSARLLATLRTATAADDLHFAGEPQALRGGFYAEMLRFRLEEPPAGLEGELVARIVPNAELGPWEATIQGAVARVGFPTAGVRLTVGEDSPLGRYLIVMDFVSGRSPLDDLRLGRILLDAPRLMRTLPRTLARISAQLHALDPDPVEAALTALRSPIPLTSTGFVSSLLQRAEELGADELAGAAKRLLDDAQPTAALRTVCHGDLHPFNVLNTPEGPTLLDWSVARIAHPAYDVAFTELLLRHPPLAVPRALGKPVALLAGHIANTFLRGYAGQVRNATAALDPYALDWHRRLHALRSLVELAGWDATGSRPPGHPWVVLEPTTRRLLGI